jgi:hypothetical protein
MPLLLVSGPIREKLWMANLAFLVCVLLLPLLLVLLGSLKTLESVYWLFPVRGHWLRLLLKGLLVADVLFCFFLFFTSGLGFFFLFPWLAR